MDRVKRFASEHPYLVAWAALAIGMVAILLWTSSEAHLLPRQLLFLVVMTILLAGACVWIISWEDPAGEDESQDADEKEPGEGTAGSGPGTPEQAATARATRAD